jgi:hypothetical protein
MEYSAMPNRIDWDMRGDKRGGFEKGEVARSVSESMMREVVVDSCWFVIMKRRFSRKIRYRR